MSMFTSKEVYKELEKLAFVRPKPLSFKAPVPAGYRLICRPLEVSENEQKTAAGLFIGSATDNILTQLNQFNQVALVEAVGHQAFKAPRFLDDEPWCKPGDFIVLPKYTGDEIFIKGIRLISIYDEQMVMRIDNQEDLFNWVDEKIDVMNKTLTEFKNKI